ncbi:MAG: DNA-3-methyladenine glycosylase family protein [Steroidobacteraceae bacterium]
MRPSAYRSLKRDPVMAALIGAAGRYQPTPMADRPPFEVLASAIAHQQLHRSAAQAILARFNTACGNGACPTPEQVLAADPAVLRATGFSFAKIAALKDLAAKTLAGVVPERAALDRLSDEQIIERLTEVRGIGRWTVEMMLIFQLGRPDVLPVDDFGVRNGFRLAYRLRGMPTARALAQFGERWKPYRSLAAWYLWRANDLAKRKLIARVARPPRIALQPAPKRKPKSKRAAKKRSRTRAGPKTAAGSRRAGK